MYTTAPSLTSVLVTLFVLFGIVRGPASGRDELGKRASCGRPEYRQFDFWIGDWDGFESGERQRVARLRVDRILDGCVLLERYKGADGHQGWSLSLYDASRSVWRQTWVTNRGELLVLKGKFQGGEMVLSGVDHAGGKRTLVHGIWKPMNGNVEETAVTSADGGKTWKPWFDLILRPHKPS